MNLGDIRALLKSNKIKDRDQGIIALKEHFAVDRLVDNVDESGNGKNWLVIFQALFEAVYSERELAAKKGTLFTADEKSKLGVAASTVRWLTERAVDKLNNKTIRACVTHLHQTMVSHGRLVEAVALNYVKTLQTILSYRQHLEHLDAEEWLTLISLSFAVVLKDKNLRSNIEDDPLALSLLYTEDEESETEVASSGKRKKMRRSPSTKVSNSSKSSTENSQAANEFVGLIADLLRCPNAPYRNKDRSLLVRSVLNRLYCYFTVFPLESGAHIDAISAVNTVLEQLALNNIDLVTEFGVKIWDRLLALWGTKQKTLKEGIISAFLVLFPYVTHNNAKEFNKSDSIGKLLRCLSEHESRWGMEALSFESIRLEVSSQDDAGPFVAQTFRYGYNFSANQVLSWATLELKADCINELFQVSESSHLNANVSTRPHKKPKLENPMSFLLHSIKNEKDWTSKVSYLQVLLFVIDRHWHIFHADLQNEIVESLLPLVATDDYATQSWAFLCLAAVVNSNGTVSSAQVSWDKIWSNAMRRTNASGVCRAACHVAHILLVSGKIPLHRIMTEIEAMAQDINIQGPTAPYDSVCAFLSQCLKISNQDIRLHRIQLEEKVMLWLTENWDTLRSARNAKEGLGWCRMEQRTVHDIFSLLLSLCGLAKHFDIVCPITLPDSIITDTLSNIYECIVIQDYLLHARIKSGPLSESPLKDHVEESTNINTPTGGSKQPTQRERKLSAFFLKVLESTIIYWEADNNGASRPQTELLRRSLDFVATCLLFENYMSVNGIQCNGSVVTSACRLLSLLFPYFNMAWSSDESSLILSAFLPLLLTKRQKTDKESWEALASPGSQTGIRKTVLNYITSSADCNPEDHLLRQLQRSVWQSSTMRSTFDDAYPILTKMLKSRLSSRSFKSVKIEDDDKDDFGTGVSRNKPFAMESWIGATRRSTLQHVTTLVNILALVPALQAVDGKPARDRILSSLMCECDDDSFDLIGNAFLRHLKSQHIHISPIAVNTILGRFEGLLMIYAYSRSERLQILATDFLTATTHLWLTEGNLNSDIRRHVRQIAHWLMEMIRDDKLRSWRSRDKIVRFLDFVLSMDPKEAYWKENLDEEGVNENQDSLSPGEILPNVVKDDDVRVRFSAAIACARLFSFVESKDTLKLYQNIFSQLCTEIKMREHMLTRLLCLGNLMITSSAFRRGPYYHLLEICLETSDYTQHVESILKSVAQKIGLPRYSDLFEAYASQLAYSIKESKRDFFRFPPHVLGYEDRKEYARATFTSFTSINFISDDPDTPNYGQELFSRHCTATDKTEIEGLVECFAETTGFQILWFFSNSYLDTMDTSSDGSDRVISYLHSKFIQLGDQEHFLKLLKENLGDIAVAILRTVGDFEYEHDGPIMNTLRNGDNSQRAARTFQSLMKYREGTDFSMHAPNLPSYSISVVLYSLNWLLKNNADDLTPLSYHILQELFGMIGVSYLINEQLRLMHCICIWIACHDSYFEDGTLLRVLIDGAIITLPQPELSHISQGILEWSFHRYAEEGKSIIKIEDVCIRICSISQQIMSSNADGKAEVDKDMLSWIEEQMLYLGQTFSLRKGIAGALAAWPRELEGELAVWCESLSCDELSSILKDKSVSSHKFKLVRRLSALADHSIYARQQFATQDFWSLKDLIPEYRLPEIEMDCFTSLLLLNAGSIESCRFDIVGQQQHSKPPPDGHDNMNEVYKYAKDAIITSLLHMLSGDSSRVIHSAYTTLRRIAGSTDFEPSVTGIVSSSYRGDVLMLKAHSIRPKQSKTVQLRSLLESGFLEISCSFADWIANFTRLLSGVLSTGDIFFSHLEDIFEVNETFAEESLSILIYVLLNSQASANYANIEHDGSNNRKIISQYFTEVIGNENTDLRCIRSIINVVLRLRHFKPINADDALAHDKWLEIDFIALSHGAIKCGAFTTALLFIELASEYSRSTDSDANTIEQILFEIYDHLDEPDGFYGIKFSNLQHFLLKRFRHEQQWEKALKFHGAEFEASGSIGLEGIMESLHSFGFNKLAMTTLQSDNVSEEFFTSSPNHLDYEFGWRTENWDLPDASGKENSSANLYIALRAVHRERDSLAVMEIIRNSMQMEMRSLRSLGNENLIQIRQITRNLMCLAQVRRWMGSDIQQDITSKNMNEKIDRWYAFCSDDSGFEFFDLERIIATRNSLLRSVRQREQRDQIGDMKSKFTKTLMDLEKFSLIRLSQAARSANRNQVALNSILRAQQLEDEATFDVVNEFSHVLWSQGEQKLAIQQLQASVEDDQAFLLKSEDAHDNLRKVRTLVQLGEWAAEACLEKSDDIHSRHFEPALRLLDDGPVCNDANIARSRGEIYYKFGTFSEQQYQSILKSPNLLRLKFYSEALTKRLKSLKEIKNDKGKYREKYREIEELEQKSQSSLKEDNAQLKSVNESMERYLMQALNMLSRCLEVSDEYDDDAAIRVCSLWFANFAKLILDETVQTNFSRVASRKFVFLSRQLCARLSNTTTPNSSNQHLLQDLLLRMCREHPFHTLYQIYPLQTLGSTSDTNRRQSKGETKHPESQTDRIAAANNIISRLKGDKQLAGKVQDIIRLCDAYSEWATYPIVDFYRNRRIPSSIPVPSQLKIRKIANMKIPVTTANTPLDPTMNYKDCVWIKGYEETYSTAGGNNLPKITCCIGTDGKRYKQLGEGRDDLRQDAVMEQVFEVCNQVLKRDRETRRRELGVRSYKVVPLAEQAGMLEYVENTQPLKWLYDAHQRYNPTDYLFKDAQRMLGIVHERNKGNTNTDAILQCFLNIKSRFKPVMRHFFTEQHKTPVKWFDMRLIYSRSVATTSIVGHILGLGDRHPGNILIDNKSGEIVHIDLGIAFEQGTKLKTPERVPFRLTPDMVDGFGISGTEGVFRRCAEETLRVLRDGSGVIKTILEVFKYDPLHQWSISPKNLEQKQSITDENHENDIYRHDFGLGLDVDIDSVNGGAEHEAAERALTTVAKKLDKSLSVEYTVNELIMESTDTLTLAQMYAGWLPFM